MTTETTSKIHPFEAAGLGIAPFKFVGAFEDRGPHTWTENGVTLTAGSPGQPMGVCKFCYQGIAICCTIEDAVGVRFTVGSDCVRKTYAKGTKVLTEVEREIRGMTKAREAARWMAMRDRLATDVELRGKLEARPSPNEYRATKGDTMLVWAEWMMANAGHSGRLDVTRTLERV